MYCPTCGIENNQQDARFCRACGVDLRAVSRVLSKSFPVKIATQLDAYLENRYQQNLRSGVANIVAFIALLSVGLGHVYFGWTKARRFHAGPKRALTLLWKLGHLDLSPQSDTGG